MVKKKFLSKFNFQISLRNTPILSEKIQFSATFGVKFNSKNLILSPNTLYSSEKLTGGKISHRLCKI